MPKTFLGKPIDEKKWQKAKDIVKKEYNFDEKDKNDERFWKLVSGVYKKMVEEPEAEKIKSSKPITPEIVQTFKSIHNKLIDLARQRYSDKATLYVIKNEMKEDYNNLAEWVGSESAADEYILKARGDKLAGWVQSLYDSKEKKEIKSLGIFATYNELERYVKSNKITKYRITAMSDDREGAYELCVLNNDNKVEAAEKDTYKKWITKIDGKTCDFCKQLDGKEILATYPFVASVGGKKMEAFRPPLHPSCRCSVEFK